VMSPTGVTNQKEKIFYRSTFFITNFKITVTL